MNETQEPGIEIDFTVRIDAEAARQLGRLLFSDLHVALPTVSEAQPPKRLLTVEEAANYLGVSKSALSGMRYVGEGPPAFKIGSRLRYRADKLDKWLESRLSTSSYDT